jgi:pimeloyl-ACP methyl ester carboxylesterase
MRRGSSWFAALTPALIMAAAGGSGAVAAGRSIRLEPCQLKTLGSPIRLAAQCGTLAVPADRSAAPSSKTIALRVAVLPAVSRDAAPDPLFFLAGGPGQAATEAYVILEQALRRINQKRDIVLVDQRGTGGSSRLDCPRNPSPELLGSTEAWVEWMKGCLAHLEGDPRLFTTSIAMADLDDVRQALGYDRINLLGGSYGTRTALTYLHQYPNRVRAVILDSVVPQDFSLGESVAKDAQRALDLMFARCAADDLCRAAFPDVKEELRKILDGLGEHPRSVKVDHPVSGVPTTFTLNRNIIAATVRFLTYEPETVALLPLLIHHTFTTGEYDRLAAQALMAEGTLGDTISQGMMYSVLCAEDVPFLKEEEVAVSSRDTYLGTTSTEPMLRLCRSWPRGAIPADFKEAVRADAPVLILNGEADPVTPPANGARVALSLPHSLSVVAPGMAHGIVFRGCVPRLVVDFIESGTLAGLDTACVQEIKPMPFFLSFAGPHP